MKKKIVAILLGLTLVLGGCSSTSTSSTGSTTSTETSSTSDSTTASTSNSTTAQAVSTSSVTTEGIDVDLTGDYSDKALDASYDEADATTITLNGTDIQVEGDGATVSDQVVTITEPGTYIVSGTLEDGQIVVDLTADENVQLVLDNADITCTDSAPILVKSVKNLYLTLADGSENTVTDGSDYVLEDTEDETNAAIYSKSDLIINGNGSLTVNANYNDGITSKDDLQIISGNITVNAKDDAIVGKDSVSIKDGTLNLTAGGDAIKATNTEDTTKGYVVIDGGTMNIDAGDDGVHSETVLAINSGDLNISNSVEGLESLNIIINDGTIDLTASDDGVNVAGGNDSTSTDQPAGGGGMGETIDGALVINGGTLNVNAGGDGLDSNGSMEMTGGMVTVSGPTDAGNGVLDYNGIFEITGGVLLASGVTGMNQAPSDTSSQVSMAVTSDSTIAAGSEVSVKDADGTVLYTFTVDKESNYFVISAPELEDGATYTIETGSQTITATGGDISAAESGMGGGMHTGGNRQMKQM